MTEESLSLSRRSLTIVGSTGLVGNNLLRGVMSLRRRESDFAPTYAVARYLPRSNDQVEDIRYIATSILDAAAVESLPHTDLAIYVAGATSNYLEQPGLTIKLGSEGVERFLTHYRSAQRCLLVGSARVYGARTTLDPLDEQTLCTMRSPDTRNIYDGVKLISEALGMCGSTSERQVVLARLANVYGPYSRASTKTAFIDLFTQSLTGRRIYLSGPPESVRNHVYAVDAANGLLRALLFGKGAETYNIGSEDHLTNLELAHSIAAAFPYPVAVHAESSATPDHMVLSIAKARRELNYFPTHSASDYIPATVKWLLEHPP
jgi:UDP-glucuronate decarboxylase